MSLPAHGTPARYNNHRCRCEACSAAKRAYSKRRRWLIATGRWSPWADAGRARAVLARHRALGVGVSRVADVAGISRETVNRIMSGDYPTITRETERKILTAKVTPARNAKVSAEGSRRRVHALMCMGYTHRVIGERAGVTRGPMDRIGAGYPLTVVWVAEAIMRVYDELSMVPAPVSQSSKVARTHAKKCGYLPPLAWDDALIDLSEDELRAEIDRQVAAMTLADLARCDRAHREQGDRSPVIVAAAEAFPARRRAARRVSQSAA